MFTILHYIKQITGDDDMLNFVLCDDNQSILNRLEKMIESILIKNESRIWLRKIIVV